MGKTIDVGLKSQTDGPEYLDQAARSAANLEKAQAAAALIKSKDMGKHETNLQKLRDRKSKLVDKIKGDIRKQAADISAAEGIDYSDDIPSREMTTSEISEIESINSLILIEKKRLRIAQLEHFSEKLVEAEKETATHEKKIQAATAALHAVQDVAQQHDIKKSELRKRIRFLSDSSLLAPPQSFARLREIHNNEHHAIEALLKY